MPLPSITKHGAKQCTAKSRRKGQPCNNPAAYGCRTCRMHGARKSESIKRGEQHPNYVHGGRTQEAELKISRKLSELRQLEDLAYALKIMAGPKTRGRKPRSI